MPLVGVRPDVVAEAEHTFGNLFHRLHYVAQKLGAQGVDGANALEGTLGELEDLLRLVLDYTSPLAVEAREVGATAILGSVGAAFGQSVAPWSEDVSRQRVVADAGHLGQAFRLMRSALGEGETGPKQMNASLREEDEIRWLVVEGFEPGRSNIGRGRGFVVWALAQKLVEAQGGLLGAETAEAGVRWSVRLPLPPE
jgi:hypothetical protein